MKKLRQIIFSFIFIFIFIVGGIFIINKTGLFQTNKISSESSLIYEKLVDLSEWTTLKYEYRNIIVSRLEQKVPLFEFNYAETIKLIEYTGYLKAGTDLSKIQISDLSADKVFIRVPKSKILDNVAETEKAKVEDVKGNIFSDYSSQIIFDEINADKKLLEEEKVNQGFLLEADKKVEQSIKSFFSVYGFNDVAVEFY